MKAFVKFFLAVGLLSFAVCCNNQNSADPFDNGKSSSQLGPDKHIQFTYGGFGDTVYALLNVTVYELNGEETKPIEGVKVSCRQKGSVDKKEYSNDNGYACLAFEKGEFDVKISKDGYKTVILEGYNAIPDQFSRAEIILETGDGSESVDVGKRLEF